MKIKHSSISPPRIEMLPLIDIVFLLLVFFIYAMLSMAVHHGLPVDLPDSAGAALETRESISITIQAAQPGVLLFVDENPVALDQMTATLQRMTAGQKESMETEIQIFADRSVSYQELFHVLDRVKEAGLTRISLQAQQESVTTP